MTRPRDTAQSSPDVIVAQRSQTSAILLDQHPLWLEALERVAEELGIRVVGKCTDPAAALDLVASNRPELFILGIEDPDGIDEADCVFEARAILPDLTVIVVSSRPNPLAIGRSLTAGAAAYVLKTSSREDLVSTVRQSLDRTVYLFSNRISSQESAATLSGTPPQLTKREVEILKLVAEGLSNAEVGKRLWLSEPTIKLHLSRTYEKLNVTNRTSASRWAHMHGLLQPQPVKGSRRASAESTNAWGSRDPAATHSRERE
jgi:DNA-binding NarL/FixJ family response regulator